MQNDSVISWHDGSTKALAWDKNDQAMHVLCVMVGVGEAKFSMILWLSRFRQLRASHM